MSMILDNNKLRDMTAEEEAELKKAKDNFELEMKDRADAEAKAISDKEKNDALKASAKAKLVAGEKLTEEEANVLVGV